MLTQIPSKAMELRTGNRAVVKAREKKFTITEGATAGKTPRRKSNFKFKQWLPKYLKWFLRAFCCKDALLRMLMITGILILCAWAASKFLIP